MANVVPEVELLNMNRRGTITLSSKCKKLLKKYPSVINDQFNPKGEDIVYTIEVPVNPNCKRDCYHLDLKRILPLIEKVQGKLVIKLPEDKPTIIINGKSFARDLKVKWLTIEGGKLELGRYTICEADNIEKLTVKGVTELGHCAFSKNRNLKQIKLIPGKEKSITVYGQVYKPADKYDLTDYESVTMEIPLLSNSPWIYVDISSVKAVRPQDRVFYAIDQYKMEKGTLELRTSPKYVINTDSKFNLLIPEADTYIPEDQYMPMVKDCLKNINGKTFAELLGLEKHKTATIEVNDIYQAIAKILKKEGKAVYIDEIIATVDASLKQKHFNWHQQQKEQDREKQEEIFKK